MLMLETKAVFRRKEPDIETTNCVVEKVIRLSGAEFDRFSKNLLRDWDFIRDNPIARSYDEEGRCHCLLVVGEGRRDGVLVNSEGGSYARYSAFVPNAEALLSVEQYSALAALNKKLVTMVDTIAGQAGIVSPDGRGVINLHDWGEMLDIDFATDSTLRSTVLDMLDSRPEIRDWELDKNELTVWRKLDDDVLSGENISDPSTTMTDMYAYGYTWDGMIPLSKERAFELFDAGHEVFRLYENGAEGVVNNQADIQFFKGMFGIENPAWTKSEQEQPLQAFILNSKKYEEGEAVGEWLTFPSDAETLRGLFERIGLDNPNKMEFTVTALRTPDYLFDAVCTHDSLDDLNMLASVLSGMEDYEIDKLRSILAGGICEIEGYADGLNNLLHPDNFDAFEFIYAHDEDALGRWYTDMHDEKPENLSFAEYGRQCAEKEGGMFVKDLDGYIMRIHEEFAHAYGGEIPDEYKIVTDALRGLQPKKPERGSEHGSKEKPSVLDEIKESRRGSLESKNKPTSKSQEKDAQNSKKRKGEHDL